MQQHFKVAPRHRGEALSKNLRDLLTGDETSFLMEAHNGLSARIVAETGFAGIWASGLSISSSLGLRDANEASWTQVLEVVEYMADSVDVPILLDGDTGYGNFNSVRRLVAKLCQRNIAGVCLEDKIFPKTNSFIGESQELAAIDEFCGKIKAAKDTQTHDQFCVVARVEALIAGLGLSEALKRADAYHKAGADAILIHSKKADGKEIFQFAEEWGNRAPLVIVPTMYYRVPTEEFIQAKISTIIWANHNVRASIAAMRDVTKKIYDLRSLASVESSLPSVKEVFEIVNQQELTDAEQKYLP
ncbi:phosphoenolpyruvate mutase [Agrobacterium vitis]|uniref:phosphoenolpyruvate mutase n=1 Tax=Agrobacterium vitis TaxID=373 RepID=UPI0008731AEC|nr:phosphoenolpyruvate mutase [Agrobacterium vitis]MCE6077963.1 phosphoenolpyruvate mutase [Agrobacterium vitis]MCF1470232.1 phosphoenolpyruvate mutase [Agrobacterium vitis]MCM2470587.1 phosphoenolpyruvate mutase [Agrobacterium vitis]MUO72654.1 phosphoenolpyruvate mutase [Agrobacterium vitis]MUO86634.1 phosphoenolpyruvate mutase [Agrobacterium vitis]